MQGGEIFVPKIPSVRMVDLVESMAAGANSTSSESARGENLHEVMCPADDSRLVLDFTTITSFNPRSAFTTRATITRRTSSASAGTGCARIRYSVGQQPQFPHDRGVADRLTFKTSQVSGAPRLSA